MANPLNTPPVDPRNPQELIEQIKRMTNNANPRDIAFQLAKQRGIPESTINQMARRLGLH